jgi:glycosyltransferase involved in cell wall biosynthesis
MPAVVHFPPDPRGPYQGPLMDAVRWTGISTDALPDPARRLRPEALAAAVRIALLPATLAWSRCRGARVLHLHWTWAFTPGPRTPAPARRACRAWFGACLAWARAIGLRIVWTAHNIMPHDPVFDDDEAARRTLVAACDAVIAHDDTAAAEVAARFGPVRRTAVIPQGVDPLSLPPRGAARQRLGVAAGRLLVVSPGRVAAYKGHRSLLAAVSHLRPDTRAGIRIAIAGEPSPAAYGDELRAAARAAGDAVSLDFQRLSAASFAGLLAAADAAVLPFESVTNSASAATVLAAGLPLIVPDLPSLRGLPDGAVIRYDPSRPVDGLAEAIEAMASAPPAQRAAMRAAALDWAASQSWTTAGAAHAALYKELGA